MTDNVSSDFGDIRSNLPLREVLEIEVKEGATNKPDISASRGLAIAREVVKQMRNVRYEKQIKGAMHLFMAVPAAFSFILGQLLNTFGEVVTYERDETRSPAYV